MTVLKCQRLRVGERGHLIFGVGGFIRVCGDKRKGSNFVFNVSSSPPLVSAPYILAFPVDRKLIVIKEAVLTCV